MVHIHARELLAYGVDGSVAGPIVPQQDLHLRELARSDAFQCTQGHRALVEGEHHNRYGGARARHHLTQAIV